MAEIAFDVQGLPPAKSEALSMLGAGHSHSQRVLRLLEAARDATQFGPWVQATGPIGLDLALYAPLGLQPSDATNVLGGVADALQEKAIAKLRISLEHLGGLADVCLYKDDRQIHEVHYRRHGSEQSRYRVRVWTLDTV
jgi:hypothetical protein